MDETHDNTHVFLHRIETVMRTFENSTYIDGKVSQSWLRDFLDYIRRNEAYGDVDLPVGNAEDFANTLKSVYLADPWSENNLDVEFSADGKRVVAGRFLIQVRRHVAYTNVHTFRMRRSIGHGF